MLRRLRALPQEALVLVALLVSIPIAVGAASNFPAISFTQVTGGLTSGGASALPVKVNADADGVTGHVVVDTSTGGSTSTPGYTRIQDATGSTVSSVTQLQNFGDGVNGIQGTLYSATFGYGFNGTNWDRLTSETGAGKGMLKTSLYGNFGTQSFQLDGGTGLLRVTSGGSINTAIATATAGPTVLKGQTTRLARVVVTTAGTASETFYDNATVCSGTILYVTPTTTSVGQIFDVQMLATNGITGCGGAGSPGVTVSYY